MLLNHEQIAHVAWLDSVCFDKEDILFVSDASASSFCNVAQQCLCRLTGNLLLILSIGPCSVVPLKQSFSNSSAHHVLSDQRHHLPHSVLTQNQHLIGLYCDQLDCEASRSRSRLSGLFNQVVEQTAQLLHSEPEPKKRSPSPQSSDRQLLYALVLEECGVRRCQDTNKHEFSLHFLDPLQSFVSSSSSSSAFTSPTASPAASSAIRSLRFTCHSKSQCNNWISAIRCANHAYIRSLLFVLQRHYQSARRRQSKLHHNRYSTALNCSQTTDQSISFNSTSLRISTTCFSGSSDPPIHCSSDIDQSTDVHGISLPLGRWIVPQSNGILAKVSQPDSCATFERSITFTLAAEVLLYFRQGQLPALQAQVTVRSGSNRLDDCQSPSSTRPLRPSRPTPLSASPPSHWSESTEIQNSLRVCFAKQFRLPSNATLNRFQYTPSSKDSGDKANECTSEFLEVQLFDVIERLTNTRVVIGHSRLAIPIDWLVRTDRSLAPVQVEIRSDLRSPSSGNPIIGSITVSLCPDSLSSTLMSSFTFSRLSNLSRSSKTMSSANHRNAPSADSAASAFESGAIHCLPNLHNTHLFLNTIYRSFQFELPPSTLCVARKLTITELMSEPTLALLLPQTIM